MARRRVKVWFDREGDYLEVTFDSAPWGILRSLGSRAKATSISSICEGSNR
jgi:hypothetical protein